MFVASRALAARAAWRDSYERGAYTPIAASGSRAGCVFAFARGHGAVTCVPRLIVTLTPDGGAPLGRGVWDDTRIALAGGRPLRDVFTGAVLQPVPADGGFTLDAAAIFERFPVALLVPADACRSCLSRPSCPSCLAMLYLTIIGGVFIAWLILAVLFTPHIPYHIQSAIDARSDHFVHVLESTCQTHLEHGNRVEILTNGDRFYPAMLDAIRQARETVNAGVLHLQEGRDRRSVHRGAVRAGARRRARDDRDGRDRQLRRLPEVGRSRCGGGLPRRGLSAVHVVPPGPAEQPHAPRAAGRRRHASRSPAAPASPTGGRSRCTASRCGAT